MQSVLIQIGSLDVFHLGQLQRALAGEFETEFLTTWKPFTPPPNPALPARNAWLLDLALRVFKRFPGVQLNNHTYFYLCLLFDRWLKSRLRQDAELLIVLSGFGLASMHDFQRSGRPVVVESGSSHTDFQHRVLVEEFRRNGQERALFPEVYRRRLREEFATADFIQIPTRFVERTYLDAGIPKEKLLRAAYGVDVDRFIPRTASDLMPTFRAICPSGVNLRKGARVLVEAWRKLHWRDAELHWIGRPWPETRHLFREEIPGLVWHDWMPHEQLCRLYRSCDVVVLPSFEEGLARVLIEGAASGLPLIATPNTGVEDFFTPGKPEGWLIAANDVDALCSALIEAKTNRSATHELGERAAARARQGFSWADYGNRVRANIHSVVRRHRPENTIEAADPS